MRAQAIPKNSVWNAMNYTPPRGRCNFKTSLMSPACPCLRFMLHPVKAATSFECDGCNHHASFHSMENAAEEAVVKKWAVQEAEERKNDGQAVEGAGRKRRRIAEKAAHSDEEVVIERQIVEVEDDDDAMEGADGLLVLPGAFANTPSQSNTATARPKRKPARNPQRPVK